MRPGAKRFPRRYSAVLCASLLAEASVLEEALELSAWDELAASLVLEALEDELPDEALELELLDVLPEELPDWEPDSEVTPLSMETARLLLLTVEPL